MRFIDFLTEQKENHAVFAFGRMNPPTTGHEVLVKKVHDVAKEVGGSHHVVLSHSQDPGKNPLSAEQKVKHAKRFFPGTNISVSDRESPSFLTQAAKLHKQGVTHLHMVAGSDRIPEYQNLLKKYNGTHEGAMFNFKKITVHSAGERDPDAEGTSGMSASKMRGHASTGNFKEFKKGIPGHVKHEHAKELYNDVRGGMKLKEDIDSQFEQILVEGVHDKGIFKAVFLAGGPGSGKDYVLDNTLSGHGLVEINSDKALEFLMDKEGLDKTMPADEKEKRDSVRKRAKNMTELKQRLAFEGRNGLIINGTGDDEEKIARIKAGLEEMGYDTSMVMVNTADEVSKQRNIERGQRGGRTVPEDIRKEKWDSVQRSRPELAKLFGSKYMEFDNSEDLRTAAPEVVKAKKEEMMGIFQNIQKFISEPPKSPTAEMWVAHELHKKDTLEIDPNGAEKTPNMGSNAAQKAKEMGLQYYGFGRYGRNGKVTYRSVHDNLVEVPSEIEHQVTKATAKMNNKKVNEEFEGFLSEAVSITIKGDTPEEVSKAFKLLKSDDDEEEVEEEYSFTGSNAINVLTLGKGLISEATEKKVKLMRDKNGKTRKFMLRRSASKEAHTKDGVVIKYKDGYAIKIKENEDVQEDIGLVQETNRTESGRISTNSTSSGRISESGSAGTTRKKITLQEIRKQKEKILESIDRGIEPGVSSASSGENFSRGVDPEIALNGKKYNRDSKKRTIKELTGDETTMSIGDKKEDELKKVGINLRTFKARKFVG